MQKNLASVPTEAAHFDLDEVLHQLKHFLPAQAPLKDFIHHNTLHAFQNLKFHQALRYASEMFGFRVSLSLEEYRSLFQSGRIREDVLEYAIRQRKGSGLLKEWKEKALLKTYEKALPPRIGALRSNWKRQYRTDLDAMVHHILFRILCSYLDQGISIWNFPVEHTGFLSSIRELERHSFTSFFRTPRARKLFLSKESDIPSLLDQLVGDPSLYKQYLFDQQFAHQGWSGMVSAVEDQPQALLDPKKISLSELVHFELLLELDALDYQFGENWSPLSTKLKSRPVDLFGEVAPAELSEVLSIWQEAFEWSYYDQVLSGLALPKNGKKEETAKSFQAIFCIDDRECSLRRYLEKHDPACETFGTPGFFSVEFFFQPEHGKFYTKQCPAPVTPNYLIKEIGTKGKRERDVHFTKPTHSLFRGWLITQTIGFWSAFKLFLSVFRPSLSPATAHSFNHMERSSKLTIESHDHSCENGLQVGFTVEEMAQRVEALLKSIGLVKNFASVVYVVGHGSSSVNNPHYAAYDCGACSGRPGSVNARVVSHMANHPAVREILRTKGIDIPAETQFLGALHDTTRDEITYFDLDTLSEPNQQKHLAHAKVMDKALDLNAKERSRRFESIDTRLSPEAIHEKILKRSVSLFEPRPELNHATNALCIVGRRELSKHLFLDRRSFMNSYDYQIDPEGQFLFNILKAAAPVCGGINLEYYFSRVDNQKLGAGTKLPHNVMGLFGVANGIDGDLRPGLPSQMIEVHDPIRLLMIVEHYPEVVLATIRRHAETYEWFNHEWVHLVVSDPSQGDLFVFRDGAFTPYEPLNKQIETVTDIAPLLESHQENFPVYVIS